jgi:hypothetical protein
VSARLAVTHVLHWVPGYLIRGGAVWGDGWWELQSIADYDAGEPQTDPAWMLEAEPRDIDADDFTEWIAEMVGYPVEVEKSSTRITCLRALKWNREEPVWLVYPAQVNQASGADLRQLLPAASRAGDQLELAPPGLVPLVPGEPAEELAAQPRRVGGVAVGLDRVLRPAVAEHLEVKRGHGGVLPCGLPHRNPAVA